MTSLFNKNQKGFSLIETLVSIAVVSIGLMSLALMTTKTIQTSKSAHEHAIAIMWAESFSQKMLALAGNQIYLLDKDNSTNDKSYYKMNPLLTCYELITLNNNSILAGDCDPQSTAAALAKADKDEAKKIMQDDKNAPLVDFHYRLVLVRENRSIDEKDPTQPKELKDCTFQHDTNVMSSTISNRCSLMIEMVWQDKQINPNQNTGGSSLEQTYNMAKYRF